MRTHGGKLGQLRLDAQAHFHDFHESVSATIDAEMLVETVGARAGIGAGTLPPPYEPFGFEHFQGAADRAAADAQRLRKRAFGRQLAVGVETVDRRRALSLSSA